MNTATLTQEIHDTEAAIDRDEAEGLERFKAEAEATDARLKAAEAEHVALRASLTKLLEEPPCPAAARHRFGAYHALPDNVDALLSSLNSRVLFLRSERSKALGALTAFGDAIAERRRKLRAAIDAIAARDAAERARIVDLLTSAGLRVVPARKGDAT